MRDEVRVPTRRGMLHGQRGVLHGRRGRAQGHHCQQHQDSSARHLRTIGQMHGVSQKNQLTFC